MYLCNIRGIFEHYHILCVQPACTSFFRILKKVLSYINYKNISVMHKLGKQSRYPRMIFGLIHKVIQDNNTVYWHTKKLSGKPFLNIYPLPSSPSILSPP